MGSSAPNNLPMPSVIPPTILPNPAMAEPTPNAAMPSAIAPIPFPESINFAPSNDSKDFKPSAILGNAAPTIQVAPAMAPPISTMAAANPAAPAITAGLANAVNPPANPFRAAPVPAPIPLPSLAAPAPAAAPPVPAADATAPPAAGNNLAATAEIALLAANLAAIARPIAIPTLPQFIDSILVAITVDITFPSASVVSTVSPASSLILIKPNLAKNRINPSLNFTMVSVVDTIAETIF